MPVTHARVVVTPDDGTSDVGSDEWNAAHVIGNGTITAAMLAAGLADRSFHFNQASPATVWNITHNLGKNPAVSVIDSGGTLVVGDVLYIDINTVRLTFSAGFSGDAWLN